MGFEPAIHFWQRSKTKRPCEEVTVTDHCICLHTNLHEVLTKYLTYDILWHAWEICGLLKNSFHSNLIVKKSIVSQTVQTPLTVSESADESLKPSSFLNTNELTLDSSSAKRLVSSSWVVKEIFSLLSCDTWDSASSNCLSRSEFSMDSFFLAASKSLRVRLVSSSLPCTSFSWCCNCLATFSAAAYNFKVTPTPYLTLSPLHKNLNERR